MTAKAVQITNLVAQELATSGLDLHVERKSGASNIDLSADVKNYCFVYPGTTSVTAQTRDWSSREVTVFIHLFRFLDESDELAQVDGLYGITEGIENTLNNKALGTFVFEQFESDSTSRELLDPDTQTSRFTFEAVIQVTYYEGTPG